MEIFFIRLLLFLIISLLLFMVLSLLLLLLLHVLGIRIRFIARISIIWITFLFLFPSHPLSSLLLFSIPSSLLKPFIMFFHKLLEKFPWVAMKSIRLSVGSITSRISIIILLLPVLIISMRSTIILLTVILVLLLLSSSTTGSCRIVTTFL